MYKAANQYANVNSISCLTAIKRIRYRWKVIHQLYFIIPLLMRRKDADKTEQPSDFLHNLEKKFKVPPDDLLKNPWLRNNLFH